MDPYKITIKPSVGKDIHGLTVNLVNRILETIESLATEPFPSGVVKLEGSDKTFRIRVGEYRVIYKFTSTEKLIEVLRVRHRRDVYRKL